MNIVSTQFFLKHKALEIYVSGCDGKCKGCHNQELRDYSLGKDYKLWLDDIKLKVKEFDSLIENIWILGGEPMLQKKSHLIDLLLSLKETNKKIYLFTRFDIIDIPLNILQYCDYVKCGEYDLNQLAEDYYINGIKLPSKNQKIYKIDSRR